MYYISSHRQHPTTLASDRRRPGKEKREILFVTPFSSIQYPLWPQLIKGSMGSYSLLSLLSSVIVAVVVRHCRCCRPSRSSLSSIIIVIIVIEEQSHLGMLDTRGGGDEQDLPERMKKRHLDLASIPTPGKRSQPNRFVQRGIDTAQSLCMVCHGCTSASASATPASPATYGPIKTLQTGPTGETRPPE